MTNREFYKDKIIELALDGQSFEVTKNGNMIACTGVDCENCIFGDKNKVCEESRKSWLEEDYTIIPYVDWSKVTVDTKVLVSNDRKTWYNRYFSHTDDKGLIYCFYMGSNSWSKPNMDFKERYNIPGEEVFAYGKLVPQQFKY